jgi:hypothetical protein
MTGRVGQAAARAVSVGRALWPAYLLASVLILCGFGWSLVGDSLSFQSDENAAYLAVMRIGWPRLDPDFYWWGTGLFYQAFAVKTVLTLGGLLTISKHGVFFIGRALSYVSALGAITCTFFWVRRLFDERTARVAACLLSVLPGLVVNAHYFKTDVPMLVWLTAALFLTTEVMTTGALGPVVWLGLTCGYAASMKYSAALLVPVAVTAVLAARPPLARPRALVILLGLVVVGFLIGEPRVWLDRHEILAGVQSVAALNRLGGPLASARPPAWIDYPLDVFPLAMTLPVALLALVGLVPAVRQAGRALLPAAVLVACYVVLLASDNQRLVRYVLPLLPVTAMLAAVAITRIWPAGFSSARLASRLAAVAVIGYAFLFSWSYVRAMAGLDPRLEAAAWVAAHASVDLPIPVLAGRAPTRPPLEPLGYRVTDINGDVRVLAEARSPYVIVSELPDRFYVEHLAASPDEQAVHAYLAAHYAEVVHFEHSQRLGWIDSKAGANIAPDWILPNPRITIYARTSASGPGR